MNMATTKTSSDQAILYTIGYEKRGLQEYLDLLLGNGVSLVIDVRKNPLSRKKGFSKKALSGALSDAGIAYRHLPELGIDSGLRQNLKGPEDYAALFQHYEANILPGNAEALGVIEELLQRFDRVALTCFELDHSSCHRNCVAGALSAKFPIAHL